MDTIIEARSRGKAGTGTARALRREGMIPAIIYGQGKESEMIAVDLKNITLESEKVGFFNKAWTISLEGKQNRVIAKDIQRHPVTDVPLHVDFMRVNSGSKVHVSIPLKFINEDASPALKRGGLLNIIVHNLEIMCPIDFLPEYIEVDLKGIEVQDGVTLDRIPLPQGAVAKHPERDHVIATIIAPASDSE